MLPSLAGHVAGEELSSAVAFDFIRFFAGAEAAGAYGERDCCVTRGQTHNAILDDDLHHPQNTVITDIHGAEYQDGEEALWVI